MLKTFRKTTLFTLTCLTLSAHAAGLFNGTVTATYGNGNTPETQTVAYPTLTAAIDWWTNNNVSNFFAGGFNERTDNLAGTINFRNLPINFTYNHATETLNILVPAAGIDKTFTAADSQGASLDSAKDEFESWFKDNEGGQITRLLQAYVKDTATDVIAGNPLSISASITEIASQIQDSYNMDMAESITGMEVAANQEVEASSDEEGDVDSTAPMATQGNIPGYGLFGADLGYGSFNLGNGQHMTNYTLPLSYTFHFNDDLSRIKIDMPLSMANIDGARSYSAALGLAYTQYVNRYWALTPSIYGGASGSIDLGSGGIMISGGLSSHAALPINQFVVGMTNAISYMSTMPITIAGYQIKYDVQNWGFVNGVDGAYRFATQPFALGLYFDNTAFVGDKWYIPSYNQVGIRLMNYITRNHATYNRFVLNTGYLFAQHNYNGINVNLGMQF